MAVPEADHWANPVPFQASGLAHIREHWPEAASAAMVALLEQADRDVAAAGNGAAWERRPRRAPRAIWA